MNFITGEFFLFIIIVTAVYYILPQKGKNIWLLAACYLFYIYLKPEQIFFLLILTAAAFLSAVLMERYYNKRKIILAACLLLNFGMLFVMKYINFASSIVSDFLGIFGKSVNPPEFNILLPLGISFYIFQLSGYLIDVYRGKIKAERNIVTFALFASFFPQIASGPIGRADALIPQFRKKKIFELSNIWEGLLLFLWGMFKKLVIADNLAVLVNAVFANPTDFSYKWLAVAVVAFSFQIFCDFSAYTDMAGGVAKLLGFDLAENFRQPYLAIGIADFWRRWHISLSSWFRDYVYIPLGGSRKGNIRKYINIMVVFLASGLWHGASMTFVIWGALNGLYQIIGDLATPIKNKLPLPKALNILITFGLTTIAWIFFKAESLSSALYIVKTIFTLGGGAVDAGLETFGFTELSFMAPLIGVIILAMVEISLSYSDFLKNAHKNIVLRYVLYFALISATIIFGAYGSGYQAQDFVYFQF